MFLQGCVSSPNSALLRTVERAGLSTLLLSANSYELPVYAQASIIEALKREKADQPITIKTLHVYLEGDGRPWLYGNKVAKNPTTKSPLALNLMLKDKQPSLYLSRPCYGLAEMPAYCDAELWTSARYSEQVVTTLNDALDTLKNRLRVEKFVLIGHSGGGSLAILLAARRDDVKTLVTFAPNVDHERWTQHFAYLPLSDSLNPVDVLPEISQLEQWHFIGGQDHILPAEILRSSFGYKNLSDVGKFDIPHVERHAEKNTTLVIYPKFDHHCCWLEAWEDYQSMIFSPQ